MYCRVCGGVVREQTEICPKCGCRPSNGKDYCGKCGIRTRPQQVMCVNCKARLDDDDPYGMKAIVNDSLNPDSPKPADGVYNHDITFLKPYYQDEFQEIYESEGAYKGRFNFAAFLFGGWWALSTPTMGGSFMICLLLAIFTAGIGVIPYCIYLGARGNYKFYQNFTAIRWSEKTYIEYWEKQMKLNKIGIYVMFIMTVIFAAIEAGVFLVLLPSAGLDFFIGVTFMIIVGMITTLPCLIGGFVSINMAVFVK